MKCSSANLLVKTPARSIATIVSAALLGAGMLMVAQADEGERFTRRVYVGAGAGVTQLEPKTNHSSLSVSDNTDAGYHLAVGYDFTTRLSAEIYYADLGAAEIAFLGQDVGPVNYQVFGLSAIAYLFNSQSGFRGGSSGPGLALREGLSLYGRVGVGGVSADSELDYTVNNRAHLALGLGAEYGFSNGFAIRGEYMALDTDQQYARLSLVKRFGRVASALPVAAAPALVQPKARSVEPAAPSEAPKPIIPASTTVNFAFDQSEITADAANTLDTLVSIIGNSDRKIALEGHTDWIASESYNQGLSLRRAESVRRYLEQAGISRSQMMVRGFGEKRPIASNESDEGRAANRRVDIRISN